MPLIRLGLINPFLAELERRRIDYAPLLKAVDFPTEQPITGGLFVPSNSMYRFVNLAAEAAGEPYLGARVGFGLDPRALPQYSVASREALTLGDLLIRIAINSEHHNTSVKMGLTIDASWASFRFLRVFKPDADTAQIDAYYVGVLSNVIKTTIPGAWNAKQIIATLANPDAIPPDFEPIGRAAGDHKKVRVTFPSQWLFEWVAPSAKAKDTAQIRDLPAPPGNLVESVRTALQPHIHETDLNVERSATICGFEKRRLARQLKANGTSLARLIARLREERAIAELTGTDRKIGEIARRVGFKDPAVFSRAFKNWTGQSPQAYRRNHR